MSIRYLRVKNQFCAKDSSGSIEQVITIRLCFGDSQRRNSPAARRIIYHNNGNEQYFPNMVCKDTGGNIDSSPSPVGSYQFNLLIWEFFRAKNLTKVT